MASPTLTGISLGGDVQSSVMALMASEGAFDRVPDCAIFADTRWEPPSVYDRIEWLRDRLSFPVTGQPPRGRENPRQPLRLSQLCGHPRLPQRARRAGQRHRTKAMHHQLLGQSDRYGNEYEGHCEVWI